MINFLNNLADWIYKKKCYFCKSSKESSKMCSKCYNELEHILPPNINRIVEGKKIYCAGVYSKNLQKLIRGLKYHRQRDLAFFLAKFMWEYFKMITDDRNFQIVPVPIYPKRLKKRKYNHMDIVAKHLGDLSGMEVNLDLIKRVKDTKPQYNLKKHERIENLQGAFEVDKTRLTEGKQILLIDDICTTGTTFEEMIKTLKSSGIDDIVCLSATTPFGE